MNAKPKHAENSIYRIEPADVRPRGTRRVIEWNYYVESKRGEFEPEEAIMSRHEPRIPYGPHPVPEAHMINFVGLGSGFAPDTPRLKLVLEVTDKDKDRPFEDMWGGGFRGGTWTVSDRAKAVLREIEREAFEFLPLITELKTTNEISPGPTYWLSEVFGFIECLPDYSHKESWVRQREGGLEFSDDAIGARKFFRSAKGFSSWVHCTAEARSKIVESALKGFSFKLVGTRQ